MSESTVTEDQTPEVETPEDSTPEVEDSTPEVEDSTPEVDENGIPTVIADDFGRMPAGWWASIYRQADSLEPRTGGYDHE